MSTISLLSLGLTPPQVRLLIPLPVQIPHSPVTLKIKKSGTPLHKLKTVLPIPLGAEHSCGHHLHLHTDLDLQFGFQDVLLPLSHITHHAGCLDMAGSDLEQKELYLPGLTSMKLLLLARQMLHLLT